MVIRNRTGTPPAPFTQEMDLFGRRKVAAPFTVFESKLLSDKRALIWDEELSGAGASSTYGESAVTLSVTSPGEYAIRQTKMRFYYQPGKMLEINATGVIGSSENVISRVGYFNSSAVAPFDSEFDGVFFENRQGTLYIVQVRSDGTEVAIPRDEWNVDKFNGNGLEDNPSGVILDPDAGQIFKFDVEWLGIGAVIFSFNINGAVYEAHRINNGNGSYTKPYIVSPNHSIRYEIRSITGPGSMHCVCGTVQSSGGLDLSFTGAIRTASRKADIFDTGTEGAVDTLFPLLSIRLKENYLDATIIPLYLSIVNTTKAVFGWSFILNPTITGVDQASWVALQESAVEYDISRDPTNTLTGGVEIDSGYVSDNNESIDHELINALRLGVTIAGARDELVLAVWRNSAVGESFLGSLSWREIL